MKPKSFNKHHRNVLAVGLVWAAMLFPSSRAETPSPPKAEAPLPAGNRKATDLVVGPNATPPWKRGFAAIIVEAAGKPVTELTYGDLVGIKELSFDNRMINPGGIELLTGLETLSANSCNITDISWLAPLTNLTTLKLNSNAISDLTPLAKMKKLVTLELEGNDVEDLSPLAKAPALQQLMIGRNRVSDIQPVGGIASLSHLSAPNNLLAALPDFGPGSKLVSIDVSFNLLDVTKGSSAKTRIDAIRSKTRVRYVPQCDSLIQDGLVEQAIRKVLNKPWSKLTEADLAELLELDVSNQPVRTLKGLEHATNLRKLFVNHTRVSDISSLSNLANMEELKIGETKVTEFEALKKMTRLRVLAVNELNIKDPAFLGEFTDLTTLTACVCNIKDFGFLARLPNLEVLDISNNPTTLEKTPPTVDGKPLLNLSKMRQLIATRVAFDDYGFLQNMPDLTELSLTQGNLKDTRLISKALGLVTVCIDGNPITDFSGLAALKKLDRLTASKTNFSDLAPLSSLVLLKFVELGGNNISDLQPLKDLPIVEGLNLEGNAIADASPIAGFSRLGQLNLDKNPLKADTPIPTLKDGAKPKLPDGFN